MTVCTIYKIKTRESKITAQCTKQSYKQEIVKNKWAGQIDRSTLSFVRVTNWGGLVLSSNKDCSIICKILLQNQYRKMMQIFVTKHINFYFSESTLKSSS